jgi:hypothetical protein
MNATEQKAKLLELAPAELAIPLKVSRAGRSYRLRHILRPPSAADWIAYEAALEMAVEELPAAGSADEPDSGEPGFKLHVRSSDAALALWSRLALRVEGYDLPADPSSAQPDSETTDWRALIPLAHKEAAVNALTLVAPAQLAARASDDSADHFFPLAAEEAPVLLEAIVAGVAYPHLLHRFRPPTVEAERAYRRLLAETLIVRGSRTPRTLLPPRLPGLIRLYDQLILGVEGYALNGKPLADAGQAVQHMDAWHKRVAVQTLFGDLTAGSAAVNEPAQELAR